MPKTRTGLSEDSLIDMKYITNDSGFTAKYFYSLIKKGDFPAPLKLGRSSRWLMNDYTFWKKKIVLKRGEQ